MIAGAEHKVRIIVSRPDIPLFRAVCTCGWKSGFKCSREKAEKTAARHRETSR